MCHFVVAIGSSGTLHKIQSYQEIYYIYELEPWVG